MKRSAHIVTRASKKVKLDEQAALEAQPDASPEPAPVLEPAPEPALVSTVDTATGYKVRTELEFAELPAKQEIDKMQLLVTATPPNVMESGALSLDVAVALDQSLSMGLKTEANSPITLLIAALQKLVKTGLRGASLSLNLFGFGEEIHPHGPSVGGFTELTQDAATRAAFEACIEKIDGVDAGTNISQAVAHAAALFNAPENLARPGVKHLVVLTDGHANMGVRDGGMILNAFREAMGQTSVFVHVLALGAHVDANFARMLCDEGKAGIVQVAPSPATLSEAFESLLSTLSRAKASFDVRVNDAAGDKRVQKYGMLLEERSVLVDFTPLPKTTLPGTLASFGSIELLPGLPEAPILVNVVAHCVAASSPAKPSRAVADAVKEAADDAELARQLKQTRSLEDRARVATLYSQRADVCGSMRCKATRLGHKAASSARCPHWRSLGNRASALIDAEDATDQQ